MTSNSETLAHGVHEESAEHKRLEESQCQEEQKYRRLFEHAVTGMFQTTPEGKFLTVNQALAQMLGYSSPNEVISTVQDIAHQLYADPERRGEYVRLIEEHGAVRGSLCHGGNHR